MKPWQPLLAAELRAVREKLIDYAVSLTRFNVPGTAAFSRTDVEQMIDGYIAVVTEAVEGKPTVTRDYFLASVLPGVFEAGMTLTELIRSVVAWDVYASSLAVAALPAEHRHEAADWLAVFFGQWNQGIVEIWSARQKTG